MFPPRVIPQLGGLRGVVWQKLVDESGSNGTSLVKRAGFTLMMVRLGGCQGCSIDSYRGMRGCTVCAKQTIRRYRGTDEELVKQFEQSCGEIEQYLRVQKD